jgi:LPS O-antigen subunit length determinant protein (WzzB/FepE family)
MDAAALDVADSAEQQLAQEYLTMRTRLIEARERANRLRRLAEHLEARVADEEHALRELEGALGMRAQLQIEQLDRALRGRRVAEVAVAILKRELQPGQVVDYKDWFALLQSAGFRVAAKDPLGSFLAHVSRSSEVESLGDRSGRYRLRSI